jgi:hypothetical protein
VIHRYTAWNSAMPTTAAPAAVTTGTSIKTMLQLATPATRLIKLLGWGYSMDDPPGADGVIDLIQSDTAATVTAHVAAGVQPAFPGIPASLLTLGVSATGYTSSSETAPTATKAFDAVSLSSVSAEAAAVMRYERWWDWDAAPVVAVSSFVRVRATTPTTAVDMRCWITWCE